jgi:hypothetical protein
MNNECEALYPLEGRRPLPHLPLCPFLFASFQSADVVSPLSPGEILFDDITTRGVKLARVPGDPLSPIAENRSEHFTFTLTSRRPPKYFVRLKEPVELLDEYGKSYSPEPKFLEKRQCTEMDFARAEAESVKTTVFVEGEGMVEKRIMSRTRPEEGVAGTVSVFGSKVLLYNVGVYIVRPALK